MPKKPCGRGPKRRALATPKTQSLRVGATVTDRFTSDDKMVGILIDQIDVDIEHVTADGAYDKNPVYDILSNQFPNEYSVINYMPENYRDKNKKQ